MAEQTVDVLIVGGGLTGAALLLALEDAGLEALMVEANDFEARLSPNFDTRALALSPASIRILEMLAVWPLLEKNATPIHCIHVSEQGRFGQTRIEGSIDRALGYVVEMTAIQAAMQERLPRCKLMSPASLVALNREENLATIRFQDKDLQIKAKIIVAADGANSSARKLAGLRGERKAYGQQAITANIGLKRPHNNLAFERFTRTGSMAMLPMSQDRASLVWALGPQEATSLMGLRDEDFLQQLQKQFGYRLGRLTSLGRRVSYPLEKMVMPEPIVWPLVFIGNAAQTLHPIAGQGFNLGLRDAVSLAQCLHQFGPNQALISPYKTMRRYDQAAITHFTDGLVELFGKQIPGLRLLRSLGLFAADVLPGIKKCVRHHASGFAGRSPDLACGIPLSVEGR